MKSLESKVDSKFDPKVPQDLKNTQLWFGSILHRRIDPNSRMMPISPSGVPMAIEAANYINPSPTLQPAQRIELYCQQYWWRLLNAMHEIFPLVTRLFGHYDFNQILAIPYLEAYPPENWELNNIGHKLPQWIEQNYHAKDKILVLSSAKLDLAYNIGFITGQHPPIRLDTLPVPNDIESIVDRKLVPQPHLHLFAFQGNMIRFRNEFLKEEPDYWIDHDFPYLKKKKLYYFVVFRNATLNIVSHEVSVEEFKLLQYMHEGHSLNEACDWLENQEEALVDKVAKNLSFWVQNWIVNQWYSLASAK